MSCDASGSYGLGEMADYLVEKEREANLIDIGISDFSGLDLNLDDETLP